MAYLGKVSKWDSIQTNPGRAVLHFVHRKLVVKAGDELCGRCQPDKQRIHALNLERSIEILFVLSCLCKNPGATSASSRDCTAELAHLLMLAMMPCATTAHDR